MPLDPTPHLLAVEPCESSGSDNHPEGRPSRVSNSIRLNHSNGSLVRVITPLPPGETIEAAQQRLLSLAGNVIP